MSKFYTNGVKIVNVSTGYVDLFLQLFRKFEVINLSSVSLKLSMLVSIEVIIP